MITTEVGEITLPMDVADEDPASSDENPEQPNSEAQGTSEGTASEEVDLGMSEGDVVIPAAMERINEDVALTQPVAQQESTRSYFLAQTLESTKTVPIVSANLPLYTGADADAAEPAEGEGEGAGDSASGEEGGEDSDESDLPTSNIIAADSTVVGSFAYRGITYAVEPGGESVAAVASDYSKLPTEFIEAQTIVLPGFVTPDSIDHYSVTRIADNAFASLTSEAATNYVISSEVGEADAVEKSALPIENREADTDSADDVEDQKSSTNEEPLGITVLGIPSSITAIDDGAFVGFNTLQYIVVEDDSPSYTTYDGVLYNADQTCLLLVPEGRLGAVRVAPSVTEVKAEAFSHCSSVEALVADPASAAYQLLSENGLYNAQNEKIEVIASDDYSSPAWNEPTAILADSIDVADHGLDELIDESLILERSSYSADDVSSVLKSNGGQIKNWTTGEIYKVDGWVSAKTPATYWDVGASGKNMYAKTPEGTTKHALELLARTDVVAFRGWAPNYDTNPTAVHTSGPLYFSSNPSLTAVWEVQLTFNLNGGSGWTDGTSSTTRTLNKWSGQKGDWSTTYTPKRTGYEFKGWSTSSTATTKDTLTVVPNRNTTYYAVWAKNNVYTVTLNSQLWKTSSDSAAVCNATSAGTTAIYYWEGRGWFNTPNPADSATGATTSTALITSPSLNGYTFGGYWTTKTGSGTQKIDGTKLKSTGAISAGTTWYAKWTIKSVHTITLNSQLWKVSSDSTAVCSATSAGTGTIYYWEGVGWFNASKSQGANPTGAASTSTALITSPSLSGYTFGGYWTTKTGSGTQKIDGTKLKSTDAISAGTTWYAKWTIKSVHTVTLNSQLWSSASAQSPTHTATSAGTGTIYYWEGVGWFNASKSQGANPTGAATTSTALVTAPSMGGYTFGGYWTTKAGTGTQKVDGGKLKAIDAITANTTWYAKWTIDSVYTVTLNSQLWSSSTASVCNATNAGTTAIYYWKGVGWFASTKNQNAIPLGAATTAAELIATLPSLNGYIFGGYWSDKTGTGTQKTDGKKLKSVAEITANETWYAKWTIDSVYTVTLNSQLWSSSATSVCNATSAGTTAIYYWKGAGWKSTKPVQGTAPGTIATTSTAILNAPTLNGYRFYDYWTEKTGGGTQKTSGSTLRTVDAITSNTTWYAKWTIDSVYTVTLNSQLWKSSTDGTAVCNATSAGTTALYYWKGAGWKTTKPTQGSAPGTAATTATELITTPPSLNGYTFGGYWNTKAGTGTQKTDGKKLKSVDAITADTTWYAKWTIDSIYTVTLNSQLWKASGDAAAVCNATSAGTTAIYYWKGAGWKSTKPVQGTAPGTAATTSTELISTPPSLNGYVFGGYWTTKTGSGTQKTDGKKLKSVDAITSDTTWYAKWTIDSVYTVTLNSQLWKASSDSAAVCNATNAGTTAIYYWKGVGWFNSTKSQGANPTGAATTSTELISTLPTLNGYTFGGYWTTKTGTGTQKTDAKKLKSTDAVTANTTWYAKWTIDSVYTVTLNSQLWASSSAATPVCSATSAGTTAIYYWKGVGWFASTKAQGANPTGGASTSTDLIATLPSLNGYVFGGYWDTKAGTGVQKTDSKKLKSTDAISVGTTWYAKWTIDDVYTVTLDSKLWKSASDSTAVCNATNAGTTTLYYWKGVGWFNSTKAQGAAPTGAASTSTDLITAPTLTGYTFEDYYAEKTGAGAQKTVGKRLKATDAISTNTTWYAKWRVHTNTVSWKFNGADDKTDYDAPNNAYGAPVYMIDPGKKAGWRFAGWQASGADKGSYGYGNNESMTMPDGGVTLTAQWTQLDRIAVSLADKHLGEGIGKVWYWPEQGYLMTEDSLVPVSVGSSIVTPPSVSDYQFLGWYATEDQNDNTSPMIDGDGNLRATSAPGSVTTWYAHWKWTSCPVNLVAEYDDIPYVTSAGDPTSIPYARFGVELSSCVEGGKIKSLPKRTGYTFMGYYTDANPEVSTADAEADRFVGTQWVDRNGNVSTNKWDVYPTEKRGKVTLYAAWRLDDCDVVFDATGGLALNTERVVVVEGTNALDGVVWHYGKPKGYLPVASDDSFYRNGYDFAGWYYLEGEDKVFVSDSEGNPTPANWQVVKTSVTLYPAWTARSYTLAFDPTYPQIEGATPESDDVKTVKVKYDEPLTLDTPEYGIFTFNGWYTDTDQSFEGMHMTNGRFTPRGMMALQTEAPIPIHGRWIEPGKASYTLFVGTPNGTELVSESPHEYRYTETIVFNGTEAPAPVEGYRFVGWVEVESDAAARKMVREGGPAESADTTPGFGPLLTRNLYFVAKWAPVQLSTSLLAKPADDDSAWLLATDKLVDYGKDGVLSWSQVCEELDVLDPSKARALYYDVAQAPFVLPDVVRKGQVFEGWKLQGSPDEPVRGIVVDPASQPNSAEMRDLVYVPVFEDALYTIVLDGNGLAENQVFEKVPYSGDFDFPYPATIATGSAFACWASDTNTVSSGTQTFFPDDTAKLAPVYDELGEMTEFGLAQLADEENVITLYAVWNAAYNVEVPLFANMAIDTERGDVIAGTNTLRPANQDDPDAIYAIESIRYEPMTTDGHVAFEGAEDKVYLSVYAGLALGEDSDEEHLLYAENVEEDGTLRYIDAKGDARTAAPLLIELGGESSVVYGRTAPDGQMSLANVTDADAPNGFVTFSLANPLTIRYGLFFENEQTRKDFAFGGKYDWLLPRNDAANKATSEDPNNENYGRRTTWSSDTMDIARLRYTVSVSNTK